MNLLTGYDGQAIHYDAIGNPTDDGTWRYTWVRGRQLSEMRKLDGSMTVRFTYNSDGLRTKKVVIEEGRTTTTEYMLHSKPWRKGNNFHKKNL